MKKFIFFFFLIFLTKLFSQKYKTNYFEYHDQINKAEFFFFKENNLDSCFYYYDKSFREFDFVFIRDVVNVAQMAMFSNNDFIKYLEKGFSNGLKIEHLKGIPLFKDYYLKNKNNKKLKSLYEINRLKYLKRINVDYLDFIYDLAIQDQIDKHKERKVYEQKIKRSISLLERKIMEYGFPGEKNIGIADSAIFKELNIPKLDFYSRVKKLDRYKIIRYFKSEDKNVSLRLPFLIMVHYFEAYNRFYPYWLAEIKRGNIHPRAVAMIHDNTYRCNCSTKYLKGYYGNNVFTTYEESKWNAESIDKNRESLFINTLEIDIQKKIYEEKFNFIFTYGLFNHR